MRFQISARVLHPFIPIAMLLLPQTGAAFGFREDAIHTSVHGGLGGLVTGVQFARRLPRWDVAQGLDPRERRRLEVNRNNDNPTEYGNTSWTLGYAFRAQPLTLSSGASQLSFSSTFGASIEGIVFTRFILGAELDMDFAHTEYYRHGTVDFSIEYVQDLRPQMRRLSQKRLIEYFIGENEQIQHPNVHFGLHFQFQRHQRVASDAGTPAWVPVASSNVDTTVSALGPTFTFEFSPYTFLKLNALVHLYDSDFYQVTAGLVTGATSRVPPVHAPLGVFQASGYLGYFPKWSFEEQFSWQLGEDWRLELLLSQVIYKEKELNMPSFSANPVLHTTLLGKWRPGLGVDFTYAFKSIYVLGSFSLKYLW
jgi:hypothetical protein